jgi:8-oxo-dGTP diphosphatase
MRTVTAAVIIREGKVLIGRRPPGSGLAGKWEFPGGKVEPGETLHDCLRRELREELGVDAVVGEHLYSGVHTYEHGQFRIEALRASIETNVLHPVDHDRVAWVEPGKLLDYDLLPADIPIAHIVMAPRETK